MGACGVGRAHLARIAGTLSAFVPFIHTFRPSFSLCIRQVWRIRKCRPARNVLNADAPDAGCSVLALSMREVFTYGADSIFVV